MVKAPALAVPQLGSCASSGRAWRLWAARHSQGEAQPLGAQPVPRVLERATCRAAYFTAFHLSGTIIDGKLFGALIDAKVHLLLVSPHALHPLYSLYALRSLPTVLTALTTLATSWLLTTVRRRHTHSTHCLPTAPTAHHTYHHTYHHT